MSTTTGTSAATSRHVEERIRIAVPPEAVWRALTDATELERWFPLDARVDPGEGGTIHMGWRNEFTGELAIQAWDPPHYLRTGWPWHGGDDTGQVTEYWLTGAAGGATVVRVVTSGFPAGAEWDEWYEGTRQGWRFELGCLRHYLERHAGEDRQVVYLRRRVEAPAAECWRRLGADGALEDPAEGALIDATGHQRALVLPRPAGAVFRLSLEPAPGPGHRDVTVWLAAWGRGREQVVEPGQAWRRRLEELFPEGETVQALGVPA